MECPQSALRNSGCNVVSCLPSSRFQYWFELKIICDKTLSHLVQCWLPEFTNVGHQECSKARMESGKRMVLEEGLDDASCV